MRHILCVTVASIMMLIGLQSAGISSPLVVNNTIAGPHTPSHPEMPD
jgi:hypothetical protein